MNNEEDLIIYKACLDLIFYTENITIKFPKVEKYSLVSNIKNSTYSIIKKVIMCYKIKDKLKKLTILNEIDVDLKMLKVLVRVSKKRKFISSNNYKAWSRKLTNVCNLLGGWIKSCVKQ